MFHPPPTNQKFSKRRAMAQFLQRNPNVAKRGPGAPGSVWASRKQTGSSSGSSGLKDGMAFQARGQQAYKDKLAAAARDQAGSASKTYKERVATAAERDVASRPSGRRGQAYQLADKNRLNNLATAAAREYSGGPQKPGLPGKRKFKNNAPFARY